VISLILRRAKTYADIAIALELDERAVRQRALAALDELAPGVAGSVDERERGEIGDYLLGQQSTAQRLVTYDAIEGSPHARAYAEAVASELAALPEAALPDVPPAPSAARGRSERAEPAPVATAPRAEGAPGRAARRPGRVQKPSSRLGGALILAVIVAVIAVVVVLATSSGSNTTATHSSSRAGAAAGGQGSSTASTATSGASKVHLLSDIKLTVPEGSGGPVGEAAVLTESGKDVLALAAEKLAPSKGFFYAAWLYNSPSQAFALGKAPEVGSDGRLKPVAVPLPEDASSFHTLIITKQTSENPTAPGEVVLTGSFTLH
jgi:hypothetical protein